LAIAGTLVLLAILSATVAFVPNMEFVALSAVNLGVFFAYLGLRSDPQGGYLFEVIVPYGLLNFLYFGIGTMYVVLVPADQDFPALAPFYLAGQALTTLGFICFLGGYAGAFRKTRPSPLGRFVPRNVLVYIVPTALGAIGLSARRFQLKSMLDYQGISAPLSFLQQFSSLFYFGWFLPWYMLWAGRLRVSVAVPVLLLLSVFATLVVFFTIGNKTLTVTLLGLPLLAYYEVKRKLPKKTLLVIVLIFVFAIFPMYNTVRQVDKNLDTSRRVDKALDLVSNWNGDKYLDASLFAFLKRVTIVTSVAAIISDTGRWVDYRYGETLLLAPIGLFVPRFLWLDKPNIGIGDEFGSTFRLKGSMDHETDISPSMVGEFYWNFSIPGVVVGMWLLGLGYRWAYQRYGAGSGFDPVRKAIYATLLPTALLLEGSVAIILVGLIKILIILVVFLVVAARLGWLEDQTAH
jgi:hypothetical protein